MRDMTWRRRLDVLPPTLAVALRLHDADYSDTVISTALDVPVEGVAALLEVARAKLDHLPDPLLGGWSGDGVSQQNQWSTTEGRPSPAT